MAHAMHMATGAGGGDSADGDAHKLEIALREVFQSIDTHHAGALDKEQITQLMDECGAELTQEEVDKVFADVDQDGGGDIDFPEFARWMMSTSEIAGKLRHGLHSKVLGGLALDDFIDEDELKKAERAAALSWSEMPTLWKNEDGDTMQTIFVCLEEPGTSKTALVVSSLMQLLIFISSVIFIVETLEVFQEDDMKETVSQMHVAEWICVVAFTIEYVIRICVCTHRPGKETGFIPYTTEFMNLVDFCAIAPAYVELVFSGEGGGFAVLRILRLARIFRVIKVGTFKENLDLVVEALRRSKSGLLLLVYLVLIFMVIMSSILYMVEEEDPNTSFSDIPSTFWCTIVTMTSVGYGDMYPVSDLGRAVGSFIMLSGILTLAVPITLIGNNFQDVWVAAKKKKEKDKMIEQMAKGGKEEEEEDEEDHHTNLEISTRLQTAIMMLEQSFKVTDHESFKQACEILQAAEDGFAEIRAANMNSINGQDSAA
jgi:voltage-gated potassium channel|eukprot:COSAG06_NODE_143_length_22242_cov_21.978323_7_plen_485_part_00